MALPNIASFAVHATGIDSLSQENITYGFELAAQAADHIVGAPSMEPVLPPKFSL